MRYPNNPQLAGWLRKSGRGDLAEQADFKLDPYSFERFYAEEETRLRGKPVAYVTDKAAFSCLTHTAGKEEAPRREEVSGTVRPIVVEAVIPGWAPWFAGAVIILELLNVLL